MDKNKKNEEAIPGIFLSIKELNHMGFDVRACDYIADISWVVGGRKVIKRDVIFISNIGIILNEVIGEAFIFDLTGNKKVTIIRHPHDIN